VTEARCREIPSLYAALQDVPDPRQARGKRHPLAAMLSLACVGLLCDRQSVLGLADLDGGSRGAVPSRIGDADVYVGTADTASSER